MKAILILLVAGAATPALAHQSGQAAPAVAPGTGSCTPEHAAMGHCKMPAPAEPAADPHAGHAVSKAEAPAPAPAASCTPEHAAMGHCKLPAPAEPAADPHAGHTEPATEAPAPAAACAPEHAAMGHCQMPSPETTDPHAGHDMAASAAPAPSATPPPPAAFSGPENAADMFYGETEMVEARGEMIREHGGLKSYRLLIDRLEARIGEGRNGYAWDAEVWYGGDIDKLRITSEGEGTLGETLEGAEVQALWSRAIDPWFDLQMGLRQDFRSGANRTYLAAGVQGLAPYWFEVAAMAFVSHRGEVTMRLEGEYDLRLTQALILQPSVELDLSLQGSPEIRVGSGLSTAEIGVRLRNEFLPKGGPAVIAPYLGVQYERAFGDTARYYRATGEERSGWHFLTGIRTWF